MNLPRDKALINIVALVHDDADEFMGAQIDDYDRNTGIASLIVDVDEIDHDEIPHQDWDTTEFHGNVATLPHTWIEPVSCTWNGYEIINDQEICERLHHYEN